MPPALLSISKESASRLIEVATKMNWGTCIIRSLAITDSTNPIITAKINITPKKYNTA